MGYEDQIGRAALTMDEGTFVCNAFALGLPEIQEIGLSAVSTCGKNIIYILL